MAKTSGDRTVESFKTSDTPWSSEKQLVDFVEHNIIKFTKDSLGLEYISHAREWYFSNSKAFGANKPRIDLMILTNKGRVGVECKLPKQAFSELSKSLSQILSYSVLADLSNNPLERLVLITTQYDPIISGVIEKYELPIDIVVLGRQQRMESFRDNKTTKVH